MLNSYSLQFIMGSLELIFLSLGINISMQISKSSICFKNLNQRNINANDVYGREYYCCQNYERVSNSQCIACKKGYTTDQGKPCEPCSRNTYGPICSENCHCDLHQRCNHVEGCINESTTLISAGEDFTFKLSLENHTAASEVNKYKNNDAIIIYIICSGVLLVLILSACLVMTYCRRKDVFNKSHTAIPTVPNRQNTTIV